jgi:hypothetical protein
MVKAGKVGSIAFRDSKSINFLPPSVKNNTDRIDTYPKDFTEKFEKNLESTGKAARLEELSAKVKEREASARERIE